MFITDADHMSLIRQSARDFAETHIRPFVMEWDEAQVFPVELFRKLGEHGFMGIVIPEEYGGAGLSYQEYITILDEISKVCGAIGLSVAAHNSLCTNHIYSFANEDQKRFYLPRLASGEWIGAWGLTETSSGSDAGGMTTFAEKDGDYYVLNGSKNFITHAISSNVAVVIARSGYGSGSKEMSAFIIEKDTPGFSAGKKENKLGMRASETACLFFDNCRVHKDQRIGAEGEGFRQALKLLDGGRISIAALSLGIARGAYECGLRYANEREQFGKKIFDFQAVSFKLAEMATKIEAAELLCRQAAFYKDHGGNVTRAGAMAKLFASETAVEGATDSVQIHGGEGPSEIQKIVIARDIQKNA